MLFSRISADDLKLNAASMWTFHNNDWRWKSAPPNDYCLWYVTDGEGEVYWYKSLRSLSRGALIIWRPDEEAVIRSDFVQKLSLFSCHFECSALPESWFDLPRPFNLTNQNYFVELARRCEELLWCDTDESKFEAKRNFRSMLYLIHEETQAKFFKEDGEMESVAAMLRDHFARPWTLDEIADKAWLSRSQLVRRFRARYGQSPLQFLNLARLENSRRMLIETDWSLEKIAVECGFCDGAHFSNAFKKQYGVAPKTLRKP